MAETGRGRGKIGKERNGENGAVKEPNVHLGPGRGREVCYLCDKIKGGGGGY